jgi:hypothetical protein
VAFSARLDIASSSATQVSQYGKINYTNIEQDFERGGKNRIVDGAAERPGW